MRKIQSWCKLVTLRLPGFVTASVVTLKAFLKLWPVVLLLVVHCSFADVCFAVDGVEFRGHKMFFAGRSDYFAGLFRDHFGEKERRRADDDDDDGGGGGGGGGGGDVDFFVIQDVAAAVFAQVVRFVYADTVHVIFAIPFENFGGSRPTNWEPPFLSFCYSQVFVNR